MMSRDVRWLSFLKYELINCENQDVNSLLIFLNDIGLRCMSDNIRTRMMNRV